MNILLLGSGGRESALAWKISQSPLTEKLYIAPGNGGTPHYGTNVDLSPLDFKAISEFTKANNVEMIVVGNEDPLVAGISDYFEGTGMLIVGPSKHGAMLEGSKDFAKQFMLRHGIPTARYKSFTAATYNEACNFLESLQPPYVLKADGLAAGKGVIITADFQEACDTLAGMFKGMFGDSSNTVVIEEFLSGIECSVFVLTDGKGNYVTLPVAKDYKRIGEGDTGPNTGGMGAVSPVPFADEEFMKKVEERIIKPTVNGLCEDNINYRGFIFFGLINVDGNPMVIEYNVRMGDPETEAVMPRIDSDLVPLLKRCAQGNLAGAHIKISPNASTTVIAVAKGYPGSYNKGDAIDLPVQLPRDVEIFHAGTKLSNGTVLTNGGRVLAVTSQRPTIPQALEECYNVLRSIQFNGITFRKDIGQDLLK